MARTKEEWATMLNGREYDNEITGEESQQAKADGIVVVFGASDDLMEFRGAIYDEAGCLGGGDAFVDMQGLLPDREEIDNHTDLKRFFARQPRARKITANWCPDKRRSWSYTTDIPHATFDIMEDGDIYCTGIVFHIEDLN